jgi:Mn2+/Fe2+ NRAMP family transporter
MSETTDDRASPGWARRLDPVRWLGPGLVVAATAIGASHLVLSPTAGARFGYALLWVVVFAHLFKYPAFEFGPRYAVATGDSLLDGYARVPGPSGWALWVFLAGTLVQGVSVLAGVLGVAAAVAAAAVPGLPLPAWSLVLGAGVALLLAGGGFDGLSALSKLMLLALAAMTAVAFLATPPPASAWTRLAVPAVPAGSLVLVAALLGWMPTGIDVSVWHSIWALEREDEWRRRARARSDDAGAAGALRVALLDMRLGYGLSVALGVMFVGLGAEVLRPAGAVPRGADVAITLARLYTDVLGGWMLPVFLVAAFFGMFSTTLGVMDGFPRAFAETVTRLRPEAAPEERRLYWGFLVGTLALALAETVLLPDPVVLVTVAAVASFLLSPVTFALNYWCVTRQVEHAELRPGPGLRAWAVAGTGFAAAAAGLFLWVEFLR